MSKPVFEDLFSFSGRRNRKSYFLAVLAIIALFVLAALVGAAGASSSSDGSGLIIVMVLLAIPLMIMNLAVTSQRIRDFGWTGWAVLLGLIPYVGFIFQVAILFIPGTQGANRYGPDPVGGSAMPAQQYGSAG